MTLEITKEDAMKYNTGDKEGLLVNKTQPSGKAAQAGVRMGDIIKEINRKPVNTTKDYCKVFW